MAITIKLLNFKEVKELLKQAASPDSRMKAQLFQLQSITELKRPLTNLSLCPVQWMQMLHHLQFHQKETCDDFFKELESEKTTCFQVTYYV